MQEMRVGSLDLEEPLGKEMATHSSILAWSIPGTEEPDGLPSVGSHRVRHDWSALAAAAAAEIISYSVAQLFLIPWTVTPQASLSFTISWSLLKLTSIELVMLCWVHPIGSPLNTFAFYLDISLHYHIFCPSLILPKIPSKDQVNWSPSSPAPIRCLVISLPSLFPHSLVIDLLPSGMLRSYHLSINSLSF